MPRLSHLVAFVLLSIGAALPAHAAVTIAFWSHELGDSFPHAFVTLRGVPDAGGAAVDRNFGFTARTLSPALLFRSVRGKLDIATPYYVRSSTAQFSTTMTDAQYAAVLALAAAWDDKGADSTYNLKTHNCVHFVMAAARIMGLTGLDHPDLMKRPRSYLQAVAAANASRITRIDESGTVYLAAPPPIGAAAAAAPALSAAAPLPVRPAPAPVR
ncbi:hypothetical protein [Sphingomonas sp. CROZ-RG-20F-R02-07]|uniref:hypothetical protein n=1 Tax=Sphingomonas sp. CROZ-RG-20F-R02-07 TaxID=2914832 RepID=UPI001F55BCFD|nr:hypothetical protein [Sphingomonas sp. CROZ-RG-20F-R02-07]